MHYRLCTFLILLFLLPTFGPWLPHNALHAIHVQQEAHHQGGIDHDGHTHGANTQPDHSLHFDVVTYFDDYLHVDLKNTDHTSLNSPAFDTHAVDYAMATILPSPVFLPAGVIQTTGPPPDSWASSRPGLPVYLATQRLRI